MNNLIFPPAGAPSGDIAAMIFQAMQQHENYREGVLAACRTFYKLDLHTLQHLRGAFSFIAQQATDERQGPDYRAGQMRLYERIEEFLANAIELAGGPEVRPGLVQEPEIPWDKLPDWVKWVCMNEQGDWTLHELEPFLHETHWSDSGAVWAFATRYKMPEYYECDWRTSLRQRPKTNDK